MLARRKAEASLGRGAPPLADLRARLASGTSVLVRATFPLGALGSEMPRQVQVTRLGAARQSWTARTIWEAPADPAFPGRGFYVLVDGSDLAQNEHVTVEVPVGAAVAGVMVPADALVYGQNQAWAYVQPEPGKFRRVAIDPAKAMDGRLFPAAGKRRSRPARPWWSRARACFWPANSIPAPKPRNRACAGSLICACASQAPSRP